MPPRTLPNSSEQGNAIRDRRNELGFTIEEASRRAGVSAKTWIQYEKGAPIRKDKMKGMLRALEWHTLPGHDAPDADVRAVLSPIDIENLVMEAREAHRCWSPFLEKRYGTTIAALFAIAMDAVLDYAESDLKELSGLPRGTHLGEISASWLDGFFPRQFATRYDYEFLYAFSCAVDFLRDDAECGLPVVPHSVMEKIALRIIDIEMHIRIKSMGVDYRIEDDCPEGLHEALCGDNDLDMYLYSRSSLVSPESPYHFDHWNERQFHLDV